MENVKKGCYFCQEKIDKIDYKNAYLLRRFMNSQGKIYPPRRHGVCTRHQRSLTEAIKKGRIMGLLPFVAR
ncbi:MAG: ribosomal protein S18 [Parcubacteria group bacterium Athens0714_25]|jgi:small subunit ribosomal protein S18|nr:30S ribosomal protein S18 [Candidatus Moranbacteria bacterium]TSD01054.1 MAG: ribosomal protein S18 [Parcubacteria group bacterium Athens0714_25]